MSDVFLEGVIIIIVNFECMPYKIRYKKRLLAIDSVTDVRKEEHEEARHVLATIQIQ